MLYFLFLIIYLCRMKYYNGCLFHKVEKDFLAQTGDRTGTGTGGDSVYKLVFFPSLFFFCNDWVIIYQLEILQFRHFGRFFWFMYSLLMKFAKELFLIYTNDFLKYKTSTLLSFFSIIIFIGGRLSILTM